MHSIPSFIIQCKGTAHVHRVHSETNDECYISMHVHAHTTAIAMAATSGVYVMLQCNALHFIVVFVSYVCCCCMLGRCLLECPCVYVVPFAIPFISIPTAFRLCV